MLLSYGFVAVLASTSSLAGVIPRTETSKIIPLTKRIHQLVNDQGVVKLEVLRDQIRKTISKVNRGFVAYQKNTGKPHPAQSKMIQARATGADPLTPETDLELWQGTISVVDFDTGSSDLFLPGPNCGSTCSGHRIYDPTSSSTSEDLKKSAGLAFGDGSTVNCEIFTDTVSIAGLTATNQSVGVATHYSSGFEIKNFNPDGLMGMAFPQISVFGTNPFFQTLVAQGSPTAAQFSFKLATSASGSELFIGGVDNSKFTGSFTNVPVKREGFWEVALDSVNVNGGAAVSALDSVIDTGTTLIIAPQSQAATFYQAIPGSEDASKTAGEGFFTFPCSSEPLVSLTFGGQSFALSSESFNLGQVSAGSSQCVGSILGTTGVDFWTVGDAFLTNVYTKFDVDNRQVGFAKLA